MTKTEFLEKIKLNIGKARMDKAFDLFQEYLGTTPGYEAFTSHVLDLKSQWNKLKKDENEGIITYENAQVTGNRIIKALSALVTQVEKGETKVPSTSNTFNNNLKKILLAVVGIVVLAVAGLFIFKKMNTPVRPNGENGEKPKTETTNSDCPKFETSSEFNILLLPFQNLAEGGLNPHISIGNRLRIFSKEFGLNTGIGISENKSQIPVSTNNAKRIAIKCNSKLIIWGSYEKISTGTIINTFYEFTDIEGSEIPMTELELDDNFRLDTVTTLSSIASSGKLTSNIENDLTLLLLGITAHQMGHPKTAWKIMENTEPKDPETAKIWGMVLSDCFIKAGKTDEAIKTYNQVLKISPEEDLARNNRAILYLKKGENDKALRDLDHQIKKDPKDVKARTYRANVYLKLNNLKEAERDIRVIEEAQPSVKDRVKVKELNTQLKEKKAIELERRKKATATLRNNPNDTKALENLTEANTRLGDYRAALQSAEMLRKVDPTNKQAHTVIIYAKEVLNIDTRSDIEKAKTAGVTREKMIQAYPIISTRVTQKSEGGN